MGLHFASVLLAGLLSLAASNQVVGTYNLLLDPGRISSWKTKWLSGQIELSKTNQGAKNVDVTFYINPSSTITDGVFEVAFPASFDLSVLATSGAALSVTGQVVQILASMVSGQDTSIKIPYIVLPNVPGPYGPIGVKTRTMPTGQILDVNAIFGEVYVTAEEGRISALDVAFAGKSSNIINRQGNTLSFKFTVFKELRMHDYIRISVASQFSLVNPSCRSVSYDGSWNVLNGTRAADRGFLDCIVSSASGAQVLWIYSLSTDLVFSPPTSNSYFITLEVSGFTNPDRDYPISSYLWKIETLRFNTRNTLESGICHGPETINDALFTASWVPTWGRPVGWILQEQTLFMDLTFKTVNRIPAGGIIVVETSADSVAWGVNSEFRCYVVTYLSPSVTCSQRAGITTITGLNTIAPGTEITLRTLSKFTTLYNAFIEEIKSITTMSAEKWLIDVGSGLAQFNLPLQSKVVNAKFNIRLEDSTGGAKVLAGGTGDEQQYVKFEIGGLSYTSANLAGNRLLQGYSVVSIGCPIASQADDHQIFFPTTNLYKQYKNSGTMTDFSTGVNNFPADKDPYDSAKGSPVTITPGSIAKTLNGKTIYTPGTISFKVGMDQVTDTFVVGLSVGKVSGLPQVISSGALILPRVVSSAASVYECTLDITDSRNILIPVRGIAQFSIDYQTFSSRGFTYFCTAAYIPGSPIRVSFKPKVLDIYPSVTSRTYYLDLIFRTADYTTYVADVTTFHDSGAKEGDAYPVDSSLTSTPSMIVTTDGSTTSFTHRVTGLGNISPQSQIVDLFFPVGIAKTTQPSLSFKTFYTLSDDSRVRYYTHSDSLLPAEQYTVELSANINTVKFTNPTISAGNNAIGGDTSSLTLRLSLPTKLTGDSYFYMIFPRGFSFASLRSVTTTNPVPSTFSFVKYFPALNLNFKFPGLLIKTLAAGANIGGVSTDVKLTGVQSPIGSLTDKLILVHADGGSRLNLYCYTKNDVDIFVTNGEITGVYVSPKSVVGRGPDGVDVTHTIVFTLAHGVDLGGSIVIYLNSAWGTNEYTACIVRGLDGASITAPVTCQRTGNMFTITSFADFRTVKGMPVTVFLQHLAAPSNSGATTLSLQMIDKLVSKASQGGTVDSFTGTGLTTGSVVTVTVPFVVPEATYNSIVIYPNFAGVTDSDLYLSLSFSYRLPARTIISITKPTSYGLANTCLSVNSQCYMSAIRYRSCSCITEGFAVMLDQDLKANIPVELFFDHAVSPPANPYAQTSSAADGFRLSATWYGTVIIADSTKYRAQQLVLPGTKVAGGISAAGTTPLLIFPTTSYETATYTFTFTVSVATTSTDRFVIIFPDEFDAYLGNVEQWFTSEVGNYYLSCSSSQLGSLFCRVDHWMLVIAISNALNPSTQVTISVSGIRNPPVGTTGYFRILHENAAGTLLEQAPTFGKVTTTALARNIDMKALTVTSSKLSSTGDYSFTFFAVDTLLTSTELQLQFPSEFDLKLVDQKSTYPCSTTWVDHSPTTQLKGPQDWNGSKLCSAKGNVIALPPPTDGINFVDTSEVRVTVKNVMTPQWGQVRSPIRDDRDFDDVDWDVWTIWSWWTSQFKIFIYQRDSMRVTSRAYSSLNSGYLGFLQPLRTISINGYNPQNKLNRIVVYPGTQTSDIAISLVNSTMPLQAKSLIFRPLTNKYTPDFNKFKYSSYVHDWKMLQEEWTINFRVAADITLAKGLYYITWKVEENRQSGVEHPAYAIPAVTLVEVPAASRGVIPFQIAAIPQLAVGTSAVPVKVSLQNPPHTEVILSIVNSGNVTTVLVEPTSLRFRPDLDFQYFNITVLPQHDFVNNATQTLLFTVSGRDANSFSANPSVTFAIKENYYTTYGNIVKMGVSNITRTSFMIAPSTDQLGVVYYSIAPKGSAIPSYSTVKNTYKSLTTSEQQWNTQQQVNTQNRVSKEMMSDPPAGSSWNVYRHQLFATHMTGFKTGGMLVMSRTETTVPILIDGLWAGGEYQIVAFFDNMNPASPGTSTRIEYVKTASVADCQPVSVVFDGFVSRLQETQVKEVLAKHIGIHPARMQEPKYFTGTPRNLLGTSNKTVTEFQFTVVANRVLNLPTPYSQTSLNFERINDLTNDLLSTLSLKLLTYTQLSARQRTKPIWQTPAQVVYVTNTSVTVRYSSNTQGKACCVTLSNTNAAISSDQVVEGYSYNWTKVPANCSASVPAQTAEMKITGMTPDEVYYVYCVLTDDYPLWPTQMDYSVSLPMPFVPVHTPKLMEVEIQLLSSAFHLAAAILLWLSFH